MTGVVCRSEYTPDENSAPIGCQRHKEHIGPHLADGYTWTNLYEKPESKQVGGNHYQGGDMQPVDVIDAFHLDFYEGNAIKYILRHGKKNGKEDLLKAIHYIEMIIERRYP